MAAAIAPALPRGALITRVTGTGRLTAGQSERQASIRRLRNRRPGS